MTRRVVITGQGIVSPLGVGVDHVFQSLLDEKSGISVVPGNMLEGIPIKIAGTVPEAESLEQAAAGELVMSQYVLPKDMKKMHRFIQLSMVAGAEAMAQADFVDDQSVANPEVQDSTKTFDPERFGCMVGSGIGGLSGIADASLLIEEKGPKRLSPFFIAANLINLASGFLSIRYGLRGPNHSVATACATGTHAIGDACQLIASDKADVMLCGGAESAVSRIGIAGFAASRALSTNFNDRPTQASRPWDRDRDGFVMGEGAGVVVLEELSHAQARGATILAEIVGYGLSGDGFHMTLPAEDGNGARRAMQMALSTAESAGVSPQDVTYINAHGTSTPAGDMIELQAIRDTFGAHADQLQISSTKSSIGHLLGAAGAVEAIFTTETMRRGIAPPTLNLDNPSEGCDMNLTPHHAQSGHYPVAMSNSFGFGGTNASLVLRLYA